MSKSSAVRALGLLWSLADRTSRRYLALTLVTVLASSAALGIAPVFLKQLVDGFERENSGVYGVSPPALIAAYILAHGLSRILTESQSMYFGFIDQRLKSQLSTYLLQHVLALPMSFHLRRQTGALSQTLSNGVLGYRLLLHHVTLTLIPLVVELGVMCLVLVALRQAAFLPILCGTVALYTAVFWKGAISVAGHARAASAANIDLAAALTDSILNYESIKLFGGEERIRKRFAEQAKMCEREWSALLHRKMQNGLAVAIVFMMSIGTSVYLAVFLVQSGSMTIGEFTLINAYLLQMIRPIETLGLAVRDFSQGTAHLQELMKLFSMTQEDNRNCRRIAAFTRAPELIFDHVGFSYPDGRRALEGVCLAARAGKTLALVGTTGSGKSTLIRLILRLLEPSEGDIFLNGLSLSEIPLDTLRSAIAVVPQDPALFNDSVAYNIGFADPDVVETDIVHAAKIAQIHDFVSRLPNGYATKVGERGVRLSGGERQRIAIARAIVRKPALLIFDEATASLDGVTEHAIFRSLGDLEYAVTMVVVAHRMSAIAQADEIVVLDCGRVVERGSHAALLQARGLYFAMWRDQLKCASCMEFPNLEHNP